MVSHFDESSSCRPDHVELAEIAEATGLPSDHSVSGYLSHLSRRCAAVGREIFWEWSRKRVNGRTPVWIEEPVGTLFEAALQE